MPYPIADPLDSGLMDTGGGHQVYWEVCGNPTGEPAVVLHGGPGSGASPWWRQFFDPGSYRVVPMDQRGCGRSIPNACDDRDALLNNTTAHLICDLERLRALLGIDRWLMFGALWGFTLGLAYAVQHPHRVAQRIPGARLDIIIEADAHGASDDTIDQLTRVLDDHAKNMS